MRGPGRPPMPGVPAPRGPARRRRPARRPQCRAPGPAAPPAPRESSPGHRPRAPESSRHPPVSLCLGYKANAGRRIISRVCSPLRTRPTHPPGTARGPGRGHGLVDGECSGTIRTSDRRVQRRRSGRVGGGCGLEGQCERPRGARRTPGERALVADQLGQARQARPRSRARRGVGGRVTVVGDGHAVWG